MISKMPKRIKDKLREYARVQAKSRELGVEIRELFSTEGIPLEALSASLDDTSAVQTEALTYLDYGEGDTEESIKEIENVYVHYKNNQVE